mmetsp:Transcript_13757/g.39297  ORF Transcript_13757/g.39297 Transcript_13757/m.39297 type:complete len:207 (+) Transcript_13757:1125-1745(+)
MPDGPPGGRLVPAQWLLLQRRRLHHDRRADAGHLALRESLLGPPAGWLQAEREAAHGLQLGSCLGALGGAPGAAAPRLAVAASGVRVCARRREDELLVCMVDGGALCRHGACRGLREPHALLPLLLTDAGASAVHGTGRLPLDERRLERALHHPHLAPGLFGRPQRGALGVRLPRMHRPGPALPGLVPLGAVLHGREGLRRSGRCA